MNIFGSWMQFLKCYKKVESKQEGLSNLETDSEIGGTLRRAMFEVEYILLDYT